MGKLASTVKLPAGSLARSIRQGAAVAPPSRVNIRYGSRGYLPSSGSGRILKRQAISVSRCERDCVIGLHHTTAYVGHLGMRIGLVDLRLRLHEKKHMIRNSLQGNDTLPGLVPKTVRSTGLTGTPGTVVVVLSTGSK